MIILNNNVIDTNIEEATGLNNEHNNVDNIDIIKDAEIKVKTVSMKFTENQKDEFNEIRDKRGENNNYSLMDELLKRYKAAEELSPYNNAPVIVNAKNALDTLLGCFELMDKNNAKYVELKKLEFQDRINKFESDKVDAMNKLNEANDKIKTQQTEIEELTKLLKNKEAQVQEVNGWLNKKIERIDLLEKKVNYLNESIKMKSDANDGYVAENFDLKENIKNLTQDNDNLNNKIAELNTNIDIIVRNKVEEALKDKEEEMFLLTKSNEQKDARISELEQIEKNLNSEVKLNETKINGLKDQNKTLLENIEFINTNMNKHIDKEVAEKTTELTNQNAILTTENSTLNNKLKEINDKYNDLEKLNTENSKTIKSQQDKLASNEGEINALNDKISKMLNNHQDEIERLAMQHKKEINGVMERNKELLENVMSAYKNQLGIPEIAANDIKKK